MNNMTNNAFLTSPLPQVSQPGRRWADGLKRGLLLRSATAIMSLGLCASALSMLTPASAQTTLGGQAKSGLTACYFTPYGGQWNDSENWSCAAGLPRVPGVGDVAIVENVTATLPAGAFSVGDIELSGSASIEGASAASTILTVVESGKSGSAWTGSSEKNIKNVTIKFNGANYELDVSTGRLIVDGANVEFNVAQGTYLSSLIIKNAGLVTAKALVKVISGSPPPEVIVGEGGGEGEGQSTIQLSILDTSRFLITSTGTWSPDYDVSIGIAAGAVFEVSGTISPLDSRYDLSFDNGSLSATQFLINSSAQLIGNDNTISGTGTLLNRGTISGSWIFDVPLLDNQGVLELDQEDIYVWGDFKQSGPNAQIRIDVQESEGPYFGRLYVDGNVDLDYAPTIAKIVLTGDYVGTVNRTFDFIYAYDGDIIGSVANAVLNSKTIQFTRIDEYGTIILQGEVIVVVGTAPVIASGSPAGGLQGQPYSFSFAATGTAPITWSITAGSLPPGLTLNSSTGVVSGTPTSIGNSTFTIQATNGAGSISQATAISVTLPIFSVISLSTSTLNFGNQNVGVTSAVRSITITNTGNGPFSILSFSGIGDFGYTSDCPTTALQPNASCTLSVTFTPLVPGASSGLISVNNNAAQQGANGNSIRLSGTGVEVPRANIIINPATSFAFGTQAIGTSSPPQVIFVSNIGQATLELQGFSLSLTSTSFSIGPAAEADNPRNHPLCVSGNTVAPGASCAIGVTFSPAATGPLTGRITITHNATPSGATGTSTINFSGTGSPRREPLIQVSGTLTFDEQIVGTISPAQTVTVTNIGTASLSVGSLSITPNNANTLATDFTVTGSCGILVPTANCNLGIAFSPNATGSAGPKAATLTVASNAINAGPTTSQVALIGTAVPVPQPIVQLSATTIGFGNVMIGSTPAKQVVTLKNIGTLALNITGFSLTGTGRSDFTETNTCGSTVNPDQSCIISLFFSPKGLGAREGVLNILSNAPTARVQLGGAGCRYLSPAAQRFFSASC